MIMERRWLGRCMAAGAEGGSGHAATRPSPAEVAKYIDHTLLRPEADTAAFDRLCQEALQYRFHSVCVNSCRVAHVAKRLAGTGIKVCSVVGFPLGSMTSPSKAFEAKEAVGAGATEVDMVINVGLLKSGDLRGVEDDIRAVRQACGADRVLKVIIETALLSREEKILACELSKKAGADFVKTCTGFAGGGATEEDLVLMRSVVGPELGIKASGGVRSYKTALMCLGAGATRLGAVSSVAIVTDAEGSGSY